MRKWRNIAAGICFALAILLIANHVFDLQGRFNEWRYLPKEPVITSEIQNTSEQQKATTPKADDPQLLELRRWQSANAETVGWIDIPGCLAQPVVQGVNNEFYLDHDATGALNRNGACFLDYEVSDAKTDNRVIYGHNMENGTAFSNLAAYLDGQYAKEHAVLSYTTEKGKFRGDVVAVFLMNLQDEGQFVPYHTYLQWNQDMNAAKYLDVLKKVTVHRLGDVKPTDRLITLSTCDNRQADARIVVIAKLTPDQA